MGVGNSETVNVSCIIEQTCPLVYIVYLFGL